MQDRHIFYTQPWSSVDTDQRASPIVLRVRLCYRRRKEQPDLSISSGVILGAPSVYIPTAKFNFLGFLEDDGCVGGPGGGRRGLSFFFSPKTKNSRPQPFFQTKGKKKSAQKLYLLLLTYLTIFRYTLYRTFLPNFFVPEALRGPSCFFKTLKVFDIIPLVP